MDDGDAEYKLVRDSMGELRVPVEAKWGAQTQRAIQNFPISGKKIEPALLHALARIKGAAASVNAELGVINLARAEAIARAAEEVTNGMWDKHFPVDVFQTGSGTSTNMNMNEVLASLATELLDNGDVIHPNDHVNASQSSNDVFPSAIHIAALMGTTWVLVPELELLADVLQTKADEFKTIVKSGRTHLMDATPVTLGQEFGGYVAAVRNGVDRIRACNERVGELPLGGTAVGTGINAPREFAARVIARLADELSLPLSEARNHFEAQGARDALVELSGALKTTAISMNKIANDLRWMASGPRSGLAEIELPSLQPGSSIMPAKVNPVIPEVVNQVCAQVIGNDTAITFAGANGVFELNTMMPVLARNVLESIRLLSSTSRAFAEKCIQGIEANPARCLSFAESSPSIGTALVPALGYDLTADVVRQSVREQRTIKEVVLERKLLDDPTVSALLDVRSMTN